MATVNLEIGLHRWDAGRYAVELRAALPEDAGDLVPTRGLTQFRLDDLQAQALDPAAYGRSLTADLFADPAVAGFFTQVVNVAQAGQHALRLRLFVGPSAPELHALRWETLRDPATDALLLTDQQVFF